MIPRIVRDSIRIFFLSGIRQSPTLSWPALLGDLRGCSPRPLRLKAFDVANPSSQRTRIITRYADRSPNNLRARHRTRSPHPASDGVEDFLLLLHALRCSAQHECLSRV